MIPSWAPYLSRRYVVRPDLSSGVHDLSVPGNLSRVSWKLSRTVLGGGDQQQRWSPTRKQAQHQTQTAILLRGGERSAVRVCRPLGSLVRCQRQSRRNLYDPDNIANYRNISHVHDRMPVILAPEEYERWLTTPPAEARSVLNLLALTPGLYATTQ